MRRQMFRTCVCLAFLTFTFYIIINSFLGEISFIDWSLSKRFIVSTVNLKYILQWTSPKHTPFVYMGVGQEGFIKRNCSFTNCYVTSARKYLGDYTHFDVIAFAGPEVIYYTEKQLPRRRSPHQKYVFAGVESACYYPVCGNKLNSFFNWTWTYKLDSDLRWGYMIIKDKQGNIVGPNREIHWIKHEVMSPVPETVKEILGGKWKLAAWIVSNCKSASDREGFVARLNKVLQKRYGLLVDIYGQCGWLKCSRDNDECFEKIKKEYHFYLSFENSFSEDYVTEKLLNAVKHYAVPVVYGGANYSRYLPSGSYLNARELGPERLAAKMYQLMNSFNEYVEYFKWTNHYSYHRQDESPDTDEYCKMCELLNDVERVKKISVIDIKSWWNLPGDGSVARW